MKDAPHSSSGGWQSLGAPQRIGSYRVLRELGRGCFGVVYQVQRGDLPRPFALKVLTAQALRSKEAVARFRQEARLASRIKDPGVVGVHDLNTEGRYPFYVMDYVEGETLEDRIRRGEVQAVEAAQIVLALARTMSAAHAVGVLHRDLKPANVILDKRTRRPRITDFGLAQEEGGMRLTQTGETVGTPFYMAPEQNLGQRDLDARVDVYALGVILYQCLTREVPFRGANFVEISQAIRAGNPLPPRHKAPNTPPELESICLRAMARERESRFQTCEALAEALETFLRASGASTEGIGAPETFSRLPMFVAVAVACSFLALAGATSAWLVHRKSSLERELDAARAAIEEEGEEEAFRMHLERAREYALTSAHRGAADDLQAQYEARLQARDAKHSEFERSVLEARGQALTDALKHADETGLLAALQGRLRDRSTLLLAQADASHDPAAISELLDDVERIAWHLPSLAPRLERSQARAAALRLVARGVRADPSENDLHKALRTLDRYPELRGNEETQTVAIRLMRARLERIAKGGADLEELISLVDATAKRVADSARLASRVGVVRAECFRRRGSYSQAVAEASKWRSATEAEVAARALFILGWSYQRLEQAQNSQACFREVLELYPNTTYGLTASTFGASSEAQVRAALNNLRRARQLSGPVLDVVLTQAWVMMTRTNQFKQGWAVLEEARRLAPDHLRVDMIEGFVLAQRQPKRAYQAFRRVLGTAAEPFPQVVRQVATLGWRLKRPQEALEAADQLVRCRPKSADPLVIRGVFRAGQAKKAEAKQDLQAALKLDRSGAYTTARGLGEQALQLLQQVDALGMSMGPLPKPVAPPWGKGALAAARRKARAGGTPEEVLPLLEEAEKAARGAAQAEVQFERVDFLHRRGRYDDSDKAAASLVKDKGKWGLRARYMQGFNELWRLRLDQGLALLDQLAKDDPQGAAGLNARAAWFGHKGDNVQGEKLARAAIAVDPTWVNPYFNLAFCLSGQAKCDAALKLLDLVVPLAPDHPSPYMCRGDSLGALRKQADSLSCYEIVIKLTAHPRSALRPLKKHASLAYSLKRYKRVIASTTKTLEQEAGEIGQRWLRALAHYGLGDVKAAKKDWRECYRINPQHTRQYLSYTPRYAGQAVAQAAQKAIQER